MRALSIILISSLAAASAATAAAPPAANAQAEKLRTALHGMMSAPDQRTPRGQAMQTVDHDQGDDHASLRAIEEVCNHDNPSATRSAICPAPVSPE